MLQTILDKILKNFMEAWPLQQFIATNPLAQRTSESIQAVTDDIESQTGTLLTPTITEFLYSYKHERITAQDLHKACEHYLTQKNKALEKPALHQAGTQLLFEFLIDHLTHEYIASHEEQYKNSNKEILVAYQLRPFFYDDPVDMIKRDCLNCLQKHFSDQCQSGASLFSTWFQNQLQQRKHWQPLFNDAPRDPMAFCEARLKQLQIPECDIESYIMQILWQLKGWLSYILWLNAHESNPWAFQQADPVELIALWLCHEVVWHAKKPDQPIFHSDHQDEEQQDIKSIATLWQAYCQRVCEQLPKPKQKQIHELNEAITPNYHDLRWLWQYAYEHHYQDYLLQQLSKPNYQQQGQYAAQWVLCIDARSEGFRRHIESTGNYMTYGFAGFFGVAMQLTDVNLEKTTNQCPALLEPDLVFKNEQATSNLLIEMDQCFHEAIAHTKKTILAPFFLFELLGLWYAFLLTSKNYAGGFTRWVRDQFGRHPQPKCNTHFSEQLLDGIDTEKASQICIDLLNTLELDRRGTVILCGHGADTENNPFQAALDCGACGGNSGYSNAIIACTLFNAPIIRESLAAKGYKLAEDCIFIPACHNTTTDKIIWFDHLIKLSQEQRELLKPIKLHANVASKQLRQDRKRNLPNHHRGPLSRAVDWAEQIPEWGLGKHAAMVIGPRAYTASLDLQQRVFLHSYNAKTDTDGSILESIMLAPMIVAHWINMQYYTSSVAPDSYGAGNKAVHNIIPNVGVIEGNQSDLRLGLPWQSVFFRQTRYHEPMRLLVVIVAPKEKVDAIINKHELLRHLIDGEWLFIKTITP